MSNIRLEIVHDFTAFMRLRNEWNSALEKSGLNNPFLRHEWLSSWWKEYGRDKELHVVCFKKGEQVIGFIPLMKYRTKLTGLGVKAIGFISSHWTRMDFIISEDRADCINQLIDLWKQSGYVVILAQMPQDSENFICLKKGLENKKIRLEDIPKPNAYMSLEGTWEDYLKGRSQKFRYELRRDRRHLEQRGTVQFARTQCLSADTLGQLKTIAGNSWQSKAGVSIMAAEEGRQFYKGISAEWPDGMLDFAILKLEHKPISFQVGVISQGCYFAFEIAYDQQYHNDSPGFILYNFLLESLFKSGLKRCDEGYLADYKKRRSNDIMAVSDLTLFPNNLLGFILYLANRAKGWLKSKSPSPRP